MPPCERPTCYTTKANRCMAPNPWILFLRESKGDGRNRAAKRVAYDEWKGAILTPEMDTPKRRQFAVCSRIIGSPLTRAASPEQRQAATNQRLVGALARARASLQVRQLQTDVVVRWRHYMQKQVLERQRDAHPCVLDNDTIQSLRNVLQINIHPGLGDPCRAMTEAMPVGRLGYRITALMDHGAYGVVMNMVNLNNVHHVLKVTRIQRGNEAHAMDVNMNGQVHEWRTTRYCDFVYGVRTHQMIHELEANNGTPLVLTAEITSAMTVKAGGDKVGLVVMTRISGRNLRAAFSDQTLSLTNKRSIARKVGQILFALHRNGMVHGDAHGGNFMLVPDGRVFVLDFDRTTSVVGIDRNLASTFKDFDMLKFMSIAPRNVWEAFFEGYTSRPRQAGWPQQRQQLYNLVTALWRRYWRHWREQVESMSI
ncbi:hypothetical protein JKP88DRAFT_248335 [Tribonema minus]|uniref:Protein kinase domain-containing protein n=1 Tax=Tribonema minus TaxID=303371 RepID=A0A835YMN9_9STRA|nr:hypothetical protein JKP88DRAFT_248335 [Tribonema minus]